MLPLPGPYSKQENIDVYMRQSKHCVKQQISGNLENCKRQPASSQSANNKPLDLQQRRKIGEQKLTQASLLRRRAPPFPSLPLHSRLAPLSHHGDRDVDAAAPRVVLQGPNPGHGERHAAGLVVDHDKADRPGRLGHNRLAFRQAGRSGVG